MDDVKYFAFTLLCCSVACRIVEFISPESNKKQITCIIGAILLLCIISPLKSMDNIDLKITSDDMYDARIEEYTEEALIDQFKTRLAERINDKLKASGIFADDIRIEINISEQELSIKSVTVMLYDQDGDKIQKVKSLLEEFLEMDVNVICTGGVN